ncbi:MAG: hypothetical protein LC722_01160 [Actinobacteria bacterium]|nr:hypothetical protein [Actinomycetota bacterium]
MAKRRVLLSDEEIRKRMLSDPQIQQRIADTLERMKETPTEPGLSEEELRPFLRDTP